MSRERESVRAEGSAEVAGRVWRRALLAVFVLAVALRVAAVLTYPAEPSNDAADYHRLAVGLIEGRGYTNDGRPTAWRPPGYPFFLAGVYAIFGASPIAGYLAQALLGGLSALLMAWLGAHIAGRRAGLVAGLLAAVYPGFVWLPRVLLSENVALVLALAALVAAAELGRTARARWALALGALLGAGVLVRSATLIAAVLLFAGLCAAAWRRGGAGRRRGLLLAAVAALTLPVVLAPWAARNYRAFGRFVPVATQDGFGIYSSYWPPLRANGRRLWGNLPGRDDPVVAAAERAGSEPAASDYFRAESLRRLRAQPTYALRLVPEKLASLLVPLDWEWFPHGAGRTRSFNLGYVLLLLPALCGAVMLWRRRAPGQWLLWVLPIAALVQAVVFYGSPRFRLPAETSAVVWAAVCLAALPRFYKRRRGLYDSGRGDARRDSDEHADEARARAA